MSVGNSIVIFRKIFLPILLMCFNQVKKTQEQKTFHANCLYANAAAPRTAGL